MKNKKTLKRLNILFVLFTLALGICVLDYMLIIGEDLRLELWTEKVVVDGVEKEKVVYPYEISPEKARNLKVVLNDSTTIYPTGVNAEFIVKDSTKLRHESARNPYYFLVGLRGIGLLATLIMIIMAVVWFVYGMRNGNPFPRKSVKLIRWIACSLLFYKILTLFVDDYNGLSLYRLFIETEYPMNYVVTISTSIQEIMIFFLTLFLAEIMSFAGKLYCENELTV